MTLVFEGVFEGGNSLGYEEWSEGNGPIDLVQENELKDNIYNLLMLLKKKNCD